MALLAFYFLSSFGRDLPGPCWSPLLKDFEGKRAQRGGSGAKWAASCMYQASATAPSSLSLLLYRCGNWPREVRWLTQGPTAGKWWNWPWGTVTLLAPMVLCWFQDLGNCSVHPWSERAWMSAGGGPTSALAGKVWMDLHLTVSAIFQDLLMPSLCFYLRHFYCLFFESSFVCWSWW